VVATTADLRAWPGVSEGVFAVDTGDTGLASTFGVLGVTYMLAMAASALVYRFPAPGYTVQAVTPSTAARAPAQTFDVSVPVATRSPQFWIAYAGFGLSITGAYGILSNG
jgi:hypothetical protein